MVETISLLLLELSNTLKFLNLTKITKLRQKLYPEMVGLPRELSSLELLVEISEKKSQYISQKNSQVISQGNSQKVSQ